MDGDFCTPFIDINGPICINDICQPQICGDNHVTGIEACDDGNMTDGDGCPSNCLSTDTTTCNILGSPCNGPSCCSGLACSAGICSTSCGPCEDLSAGVCIPQMIGTPACCAFDSNYQGCSTCNILGSICNSTTPPCCPGSTCTAGICSTTLLTRKELEPLKTNKVKNKRNHRKNKKNNEKIVNFNIEPSINSTENQNVKELKLENNVDVGTEKETSFKSRINYIAPGLQCMQVSMAGIDASLMAFDADFMANMNFISAVIASVMAYDPAAMAAMDSGDAACTTAARPACTTDMTNGIAVGNPTVIPNTGYCVQCTKDANCMAPNSKCNTMHIGMNNNIPVWPPFTCVQCLQDNDCPAGDTDLNINGKIAMIMLDMCDQRIVTHTSPLGSTPVNTPTRYQCQECTVNYSYPNGGGDTMNCAAGQICVHTNFGNMGGFPNYSAGTIDIRSICISRPSLATWWLWWPTLNAYGFNVATGAAAGCPGMAGDACTSAIAIQQTPNPTNNYNTNYRVYEYTGMCADLMAVLWSGIVPIPGTGTIFNVQFPGGGATMGVVSGTGLYCAPTGGANDFNGRWYDSN